MKKYNIKLLSIDLDGTLLNFFKKISHKDILALKKFNSNGGIIFINTGKNLNKTIKIINYLNKHLKFPIRYFSCLNGNIIYDMKNAKIIHQSFIEKQTVKKILNIIKQKHLWYSCYQIKNNNIKNYFNKFGNFDNICKINLIANVKKIIKYQKMLNELKEIKDIEVLHTNHRLFEIVKKNHNKAMSLNKIAKLLNINSNYIGAIGDSFNDYPMFKLAKYSFLVKKNASDKLQQTTNHYLNISHAKVAYVINHFINLD